MWMTLFLSIMHKLSETSSYFCERYDTTGRAGLTALQKCLEYYCSGIIEYFGDEFLHHPTVIDTQDLLAKSEECGFPNMLVSIDYMHW
jgi:hypothetical protein